MAERPAAEAKGSGGPAASPASDPVAFRPATDADLPACAEIHRVSIADYLGPLGVDPGPGDPARMIALFAHLRSTDPERFLVAERDGVPVGFVSANVRGGAWFLAMLFVLPAEQGRGLGKRLLEAVLPGPDDRAPDGERLSLAVAADSLQPISNALYAQYGMVPRMPAFHLRGRIARPDAFGALPDGVVAIPFASIDDVPAGSGEARPAADVTTVVDIELLGYLRPRDHRWLATERRGWAFTDADGEPLGYAYVRDDGRIGPVAALDPALLAPLVGHVVRASARPDGMHSLFAPGAAGELFTACLAAGMRIGEAPELVGWDRPPADFSRYVPIGLALL